MQKHIKILSISIVMIIEGTQSADMPQIIW